MAGTFTVGAHAVGDETRCYVIAEGGRNHQGSVKTCMELFKAAKDAGAQAVKLQKRHNRTLYTKAMYGRPYDNEDSYGATYNAQREALEFGAVEYRDLQQCCRERGVDFFAAAFELERGDLLASPSA